MGCSNTFDCCYKNKIILRRGLFSYKILFLKRRKVKIKTNKFRDEKVWKTGIFITLKAISWYFHYIVLIKWIMLIKLL